MPSDNPDSDRKPSTARLQPQIVRPLPQAPLLNYTLSTVCPACTAPTVRRACKVRCERCGFVWDCSEL
ncbi:MAG: hypothetical protein DIU68_010400 [Chloroflexota bacterium]